MQRLVRDAVDIDVNDPARGHVGGDPVVRRPGIALMICSAIRRTATPIPIGTSSADVNRLANEKSHEHRDHAEPQPPTVAAAESAVKTAMPVSRPTMSIV